MPAPSKVTALARFARPLTRADKLWLVVVFAATTALMWATHKPIGHVRDEGYYFKAARLYQGWFEQLGNDWSEGRLLAPFTDASTKKHWNYNHEHPPVAKVAFALSHLFLHEKTGWLDDTTAYRVPAFLFSGLLSLSLFLLARPWGRTAAVLAPALFWAVPRHFFHGHIACFDIPVAALWLFFLWTAARTLATGRGLVWAGVVFGLTLATKHNAFFLPVVIGLHWLVTEHRDLRAEGWTRLIARVPPLLWSMALLGPLVLYLSWPWLWHHPFERVAWWMSFHGRHVHYPWQYFGEVLRAPPFPALYPLALEAVTVPLAVLLAMTAGAWVWVVKGAGSFSRTLRTRFGELDRYEWLLALAALVGLLPFLTTRVPIFGGIKHWMPTMALLCVPAASLIVQAGRAAWPSRPKLAIAVLVVLVLAPATIATRRFHPWGTSAYNELAGGAAGGAALGMQRQYWSNNVTAVLPWINEHAARNASVYFHEVNFESFRAYQDDGLVRRDIRYARSPQDASIAAYQYHQEFRDREFEIWNTFGTRTPALTFAIDEAPQVVVYRR